VLGRVLARSGVPGVIISILLGLVALVVLDVVIVCIAAFVVVHQTGWRRADSRDLKRYVRDREDVR